MNRTVNAQVIYFFCTLLILVIFLAACVTFIVLSVQVANEKNELKRKSTQDITIVMSFTTTKIPTSTPNLKNDDFIESNFTTVEDVMSHSHDESKHSNHTL